MKSRPTLRHWGIRNFKSIEAAELDMSPLTLLVGKNSAGKSSIIQSLLLFAQSSDVETDGQVPLNGPLTSLGLFDDTVSAFAENREISFSGEFGLPSRVLQGAPPSRRGAMTRRYLPSTDFRWKGTLVEDTRTGEARFGQGSFVRPNPRAKVELKFELRQDAASEEVGDIERSGFGPYRVRAKSDRGTEGTEYEFAQFRAGVPVEGLREWSPVDWWIEDAFSDLRAFSFAPQMRRPGPTARRIVEEAGTGNDALLDQTVERLATYIAHSIQAEREERISGGEDSPFFSNVVESLDLKPPQAAFMVPRLEALREELRRLVREKLGQSADIPEHRTDPGGLQDRALGRHRAFDPWQQFWARRIKYLGPLREEPRAAYSRQRSSTVFAPLGLKGEFAASFLYNNQANYYVVPLPDGEARRVQLGEAVNEWLRHMRVANRVEVKAEGRMGLELRVDGRNVTSVGTGVSQLLPVLIVCLTAEAETLTLIEQPEIHVEPGGQQLLAEFLLAIAGSGRQLLVETHSEYLVTRLRLLTAQTPELAETYAIYFAEQEHGRSVFRSVRVTSSGGIDDWPAGFFDQAASDAKELMLQAVRHPPG